jgi:signal transduction histidine kinase
MRLRGDVTRGALARQAVRITRCNDQVCLTVTDQGPGIAPEMLAWMFKAFIPQDIAHHMSGHRLSLAIAQQIVLAHDGTIQVGSTPGVETTFTVRLPEGADAEIS